MPRLPWRSRISRWLRNLAETLDPAPAGLDLDGAPAVWADRVREAAARGRGRVRPVGTRRAPGPPTAPGRRPLPSDVAPVAHDRTRRPGRVRFRDRLPDRPAHPVAGNPEAAAAQGRARDAVRRVSTPGETSPDRTPRGTTPPPWQERAQTPQPRPVGPLVRAVSPLRGAELRRPLPPRSVPSRSEQAEQAAQAADSLGQRAAGRSGHETRGPAAVPFPDARDHPPGRARVSPPPAREPGVLPPTLRTSPAPAAPPLPGNAADARPEPAWAQSNPAQSPPRPADARPERAQSVPEPSPAPPVLAASLWPDLPERPEPAAQPLPALESLLYRLDRLSAEQAAT